MAIVLNVLTSPRSHDCIKLVSRTTLEAGATVSRLDADAAETETCWKVAVPALAMIRSIEGPKPLSHTCQNLCLGATLCDVGCLNNRLNEP